MSENLVKIKIDGNIHEVPAGITLIQACDYVGIEIPRFCYHDRLSVAGNCRMCLVEMVGGPPKPIASCATNVAEGIEIKTNSPMTKNAREGAMKFLLANHPLDCPICDQGGECDLQDQALFYGEGEGGFQENKRAVKEKDFGPLIKTHMTRCIHCTRCVRFATEVAGVEEIGAIGRGEDMEISTYVEKTISSELCPVGALTSKPYMFKARPWELTKTETIDVHDAVGSHIRVDSRGQEVMRILPRLNENINEEWISDKTRFAVDGLKRQRLDRPYVKRNGKLEEASWAEAISEIKAKINSKPKEICALSGELSDVESLYALKKLMQNLGSSNFDSRPAGSIMKNDVRSAYIFNSEISRIEEADLCLLIGVNPRVEASIINARIGNRFRNNKDLPIANIGVVNDLTYDCEQLGNNTKIVADIAAGKHEFSNKLKKAKKPLIIIGESCFIGENAQSLIANINEIVANNSVITKEWNGYNILQNSASRVGALDVGFLPTGAGKNTQEILSGAAKNKQNQVNFLLGFDEGDLSGIKDNFNIYIGTHGDQGAHIADVILPASTYIEKFATFVNTEGRVQRTVKAVANIGEAKNDLEIVLEISQELGFQISKEEFYEDMYEKFPHLQDLTKIHKEDQLINYDKSKLENAEFSNLIDNFYMTNVISRNSKTMSEASKYNLKQEVA
jgi:NADH-quinone oxidoreductase subunit G